MNITCASAASRIAAAIGCVFGLVGVVSAAAVPAGTATFDGGRCTAKFVRANSGIVNETERVCVGEPPVFGVDADVILQFRPLTPTFPPNPKCDPKGLVTWFGGWANYEASIEPWFKFGPVYTYNVCVYLENPVVAAGTIDSSDYDGSDTAPVPLAGKFNVCVSGTYANTTYNVADAKYISTDNWAIYTDGLPSWPQLGLNFGEVQINGQFVAWGAYSSAHMYCTIMTLSSGQQLNLAVFDGYGDSNAKEAGWYGDNVGTLNYTVTYVGQ